MGMFTAYLKDDHEACYSSVAYSDEIVLAEGVTCFGRNTAKTMPFSATLRVSSTVRKLTFYHPFQFCIFISKDNPQFTKDSEGVVWDGKGNILVVEGDEKHLDQVLDLHPEYLTFFRDYVILNDVHSKVGKPKGKKRALYIGENVQTLEYESFSYFDPYFISDRNESFRMIDIGGEEKDYYGIYEIKTQSLLYVDTFPMRMAYKVRRICHDAFRKNIHCGDAPALFHDFGWRKAFFRVVEVIEGGNYFPGCISSEDIYSEEHFRWKNYQDPSFCLPLIIPKRITYFDPTSKILNVPLIINESACFKGVRFLTPESLPALDDPDFNLSSYYASLAEELEEKIIYLVESLLVLSVEENYLYPFLEAIPFRYRILRKVREYLHRIQKESPELNILLVSRMEKLEQPSLSLDETEDMLEDCFYYRRKEGKYYPLYLKGNTVFSLKTLSQSDDTIDYRMLSFSNNPENVTLKDTDSLSLPRFLNRTKREDELYQWHIGKLEFEEVFHVFSLLEFSDDFDEKEKRYLLRHPYLYVTEEFFRKRNGRITTDDVQKVIRVLLLGTEKKAVVNRCEELREEKKQKYSLQEIKPDLLILTIGSRHLFFLVKGDCDRDSCPKADCLFLGSELVGDGFSAAEGTVNLTQWLFADIDSFDFNKQ